MKNTNEKYFKVSAKFGHVKKNFYYLGEIFVKCENAKAAAKYVMKMPRVKRNHRDAILSVEGVTKEEFIIGKKEYMNNPYFKCHSWQEQRQIEYLIEDKIFPETEIQMNYRLHREGKEYKIYEKDEKRLENYYGKKLRNKKKFCKLNHLMEDKFCNYNYCIM